MRYLRSKCVASTALVVCALAPVYGVQMEKGPSYLTDSHGASGVAHAFLELSEVAPEYDKYWKGALDWLISVAQRDEEGALRGTCPRLRRKGTRAIGSASRACATPFGCSLRATTGVATNDTDTRPWPVCGRWSSGSPGQSVRRTAPRTPGRTRIGRRIAHQECWRDIPTDSAT